jgi:hypothetical protein
MYTVEARSYLANDYNLYNMAGGIFNPSKELPHENDH